MSKENYTSELNNFHAESLWQVACVLIPGGLLALLNTTAIGVSIPAVVADLNTDVQAAQWVTTAYILMTAIAIPVGGWASVRFGVRSTWLTALTFFIVGALASASATDIIWLTTARIVQAAGGGILEPIMLTAMARRAGPQKMGRIMGIVSAVMSLGPLAGPPLAGIVVDGIGWRWIYWFSALAGIAILLASWFLIRDNERQPSRLDSPGLVLVTLATVSQLLGLSRAATAGRFDITAVFLVLFGLACLGAFAWWGKRLGEKAVINLTTFKSSGFAPAVLIMALMGAAIFPLFFGLPQFYQGVIGLNAATAGLLMIPYGIGNLLAMPLSGYLSDKIAARLAVLIGAGMTLIGFSILAQTGLNISNTGFAGISFMIGTGLGFIAIPTVSYMYRNLPPKLVSSGSTILFTVLQIGGAFGVALLVLMLGGATWDRSVGTTPFWMPVGAVAMIAATAMRLKKKSVA